jgi:hypothetical protein
MQGYAPPTLCLDRLPVLNRDRLTFSAFAFSAISISSPRYTAAQSTMGAAHSAVRLR